MEDVPEGKHFSFPKSEERTLEFWDEIDAFNEQLRRTEGQPEYTFYDGPPFATGLPHYGHILAGTLKVRLGSVACLGLIDRARVAAVADAGRPTAIRAGRSLSQKNKKTKQKNKNKTNRTSSRATPP